MRDWCLHFSLAELDEKLRNEIRECNNKGLSPSICAIRLLAVPKAARLRGMLNSLTAKNKRKNEIPSCVSYIGQYEEFCTFRDKQEQLTANKRRTETFLRIMTESGYGPELPSQPFRSVNISQRMPAILSV